MPPTRAIRTKIITGPIIDIDGGVWYHNINQDGYYQHPLPPVIRCSNRQLAPIFLGVDNYLISPVTSLSDQLKEMTIRDIITSDAVHHNDLLVLTCDGTVHWCRLINGSLGIRTTISTNVMCVNMIDSYSNSDNDAAMLVVCVLKDRIQLINTALTDDDVKTTTTEYLLETYMPEGVKLIDKMIIVSNTNVIWRLHYVKGESEDDVNVVLSKIATIPKLLDMIYYFDMNRVLIIEDYNTIVTIDLNTLQQIRNSIPGYKFVRCLDASMIQGRTIGYIQGIDDQAYSFDGRTVEKLDLPMNISQRIIRDKPTKPIRSV